MLHITKELKRQLTMLELSWSPVGHKDCYVGNIHFNVAELGSRQIKDIMPYYMPNIWHFEYSEDDNHVLYFPLIPRLKEEYLKYNSAMNQKVCAFRDENIERILKYPSKNFFDELDREIATNIGNEIIKNLRSGIKVMQYDSKKESKRFDYLFAAFVILICMIMLYNHIVQLHTKSRNV